MKNPFLKVLILLSEGSMISKMLRKRVIKNYCKNLPFLLKKDYGSQYDCNPDQIIATINRYNLNEKYASLAVVLFAEKKAAIQFIGNDYPAISKELFVEVSQYSSWLSLYIDSASMESGEGSE
ncbi:DUF6559 family protein [Pseudoalteromonas piscicida]|uniref:DUF6559 family protein n=1 Tax=Pseudoalteromonas piscicida TaxID=43662 RepID=UPI0030964061